MNRIQNNPINEKWYVSVHEETTVGGTTHRVVTYSRTYQKGGTPVPKEIVAAILGIEKAIDTHDSEDSD